MIKFKFAVEIYSFKKNCGFRSLTAFFTFPLSNIFKTALFTIQ
jgi:hypothetical protein